MLASLAVSIPEALDNLTGEEINTVYRKLRLQLITFGEGFDATGVLCTLEPASRDESRNTKKALRFRTSLSEHDTKLSLTIV